LTGTHLVFPAWDSRFHYVFWRPITAIREGDDDGNPETAGDPNWQPFINTPNYPDYTSGANNVTGAVTRMLALYFGTDHMTFSMLLQRIRQLASRRAHTTTSQMRLRTWSMPRSTRAFTFARRISRGGNKADTWPGGYSLISCGRSMLTTMMMTTTRIDPALSRAVV